MSEDNKQIINEETQKYLEEILSMRAFISNPTRLDIPGFGMVTATSMVQYHYLRGKPVPYFRFRRNQTESGEFFREGEKIFVRYNNGEATR